MLKDLQEEKKDKDFFFPKQIEKLLNNTRDSPESEGMQVGNVRFLIKRNRELMCGKNELCIFLNRVEKKICWKRSHSISPNVIHRMSVNKDDTADKAYVDFQNKHLW